MLAKTTLRAFPRALICNAGWLAIDRLVGLCASVGTLSIIARWLGPESTAVVSYGLALQQLAIAVCLITSNYGTLPRLTRVKKLNGPITNLLGAKIAVVSVAFFLFVVYAWFTTTSKGEFQTITILLAVLFFLEPASLIGAVFQSRNANDKLVLPKAVAALSKLTLAAACALADTSLEFFALAWIVEAFLQLGFGVIRARQHMHMDFVPSQLRIARMRIYLRFGFTFYEATASALLRAH